MVRFALRGGGVALGGVAAAAAEAVRHALITPKSKVTVTSCCGGLRGGGGIQLIQGAGSLWTSEKDARRTRKGREE